MKSTGHFSFVYYGVYLYPSSYLSWPTVLLNVLQALLFQECRFDLDRKVAGRPTVINLNNGFIRRRLRFGGKMPARVGSAVYI